MIGAAQLPAERSAAGLISVEQQRAIAEVQAKMIIARSHPRDPIRSMDLILNDCQRVSVAEDAVYEYSKGGTRISGPSIKLLQAIATRWGNIASGVSEISRSNGVSEVLAEAWDLETGSYDFRKFPVKHWVDTKSGGRPTTDEREIYELVMNMGQRRKRSCLEAVIPREVVDAAVKQCEVTLKSTADTSPEGVQKMLEAFAQFGVSKEQIEKRIQRRLDAVQPAQIVALKRIYVSLRDDMSAPGDWFEPVDVGTVTVEPAKEKKKDKPPYPDAEFEKNLAVWRKSVDEKKQTPEVIIKMISTRFALSDEQRKSIEALAHPGPAQSGTQQEGEKK